MTSMKTVLMIEAVQNHTPDVLVIDERQIMHGPSLTEAGLPSQEPEFMPEVRDAKHRPLPLALPFAPVGFNLADWPPAKTK